jgi:hypothetical protein
MVVIRIRVVIEIVMIVKGAVSDKNISFNCSRCCELLKKKRWC